MRLLELVKRTVTTEQEFATLKHQIRQELHNEAGAIRNNPKLVAECLSRKITALQFAINSCGDPSENPRRLTLLQIAVILKNSAMIQILLELGADLNYFGEDPYHRTPLHFAAHANNVTTLEVLLRHIANVHTKDLQENTPLLVAIKDGCKSDDEALTTLCLFMKYKADVNAVDSAKHALIQYAAAKGFFKTVRFLLKQQYQCVLIPQEKSASPLKPILYLPIMRGDVELVGYLLAKGINIAAIEGQEKCTIFATACRLQNPHIVREMLPYVTDAILIEEALREMNRHKINNDEIRTMLNQKKNLLPALLPTDIEEKLIQLTQLQPPVMEPNNLFPPAENVFSAQDNIKQDTISKNSMAGAILIPEVFNNSAKSSAEQSSHATNNRALAREMRSAPQSGHAPHHFWNNPSPISTPQGNGTAQQYMRNAIANESLYSNVAYTPVSSSPNLNDDSLFPGARFKAVNRGPNHRVAFSTSADARGAQTLLVPPKLDNSTAAPK